MNRFTVGVIAACAAGLGGCQALLTSDARSGLAENEAVVVTLDEMSPAAERAATDVRRELGAGAGGAGMVAADVATLSAGLAAKAVEFAVDRAAEALRKEADAHTAQFGASKRGEFYVVTPAPSGPAGGVYTAQVRLKGFSITRVAGDEPRFHACVQVIASERGDGIAFRLTDVWYRGAKAKVLDRGNLTEGWLWTFAGLHPEGLNCKLNLSLRTLRVDGRAGTATVSTRTYAFGPFDGIVLPGTQQGPPVRVAVEGKTYDLSQYHDWVHREPGAETDWVEPVPLSRAAQGDQPWGNGLYSVKIEVTETDANAETLSGLAAKVEEHKGEWTQQIQSAAGSLFGAPEKP